MFYFIILFLIIPLYICYKYITFYTIQNYKYISFKLFTFVITFTLIYFCNCNIFIYKSIFYKNQRQAKYFKDYSLYYNIVKKGIVPFFICQKISNFATYFLLRINIFQEIKTRNKIYGKQTRYRL